MSAFLIYYHPPKIPEDTAIGVQSIKIPCGRHNSWLNSKRSEPRNYEELDRCCSALYGMLLRALSPCPGLLRNYNHKQWLLILAFTLASDIPRSILHLFIA